MYLAPEDLAKIGYLYLRDGRWEDARVLPQGLVDRATARHVERVNSAGWGYGLQWWRLDRRGVDLWVGLGFGGQYRSILEVDRASGSEIRIYAKQQVEDER